MKQALLAQQSFPGAADWLDPISDSRFFRGLTMFDVAVVRGSGAATEQKKSLPLRWRRSLEEISLGSMTLAEEAIPPSLPVPKNVCMVAQSLRRQPLVKRSSPAYIPNPKGFFCLPPMLSPNLEERTLSPAEMVAAQIALAMEYREQQRRQRVQGLRQRLFHASENSSVVAEPPPLAMPAFVPHAPQYQPIVANDEVADLVENMQELMQATYQQIIHPEPRSITIEELSPTALQRMLADTMAVSSEAVPEAVPEIIYNEVDTEEELTEEDAPVPEAEPLEWHPSTDGGMLMVLGEFDPQTDRLVCHTEGMAYTLRHRLGIVTLRFANGDTIRFSHPEIVLKKNDVSKVVNFI